MVKGIRKNEIEQEKSVLRWGSLAGVSGAVLFILVVVFVGMFVPADPAEMSKLVTRFPEIKNIRVVENLIYLTALILEVPLFLALYFVLRKTHLVSALFGSVIGILGLLAMMASATPHVAHASLSELYLASTTQPTNLETLAHLWKATWGVFDAILYIGFFVVPIGLIILGTGLYSSPSFGKGFGGSIFLLGLIGFVAAVFQMIYPSSIAGVGSYFACLICYLSLGLKVYSLSKKTYAE